MGEWTIRATGTAHQSRAVVSREVLLTDLNQAPECLLNRGSDTADGQHSLQTGAHSINTIATDQTAWFDYR